MIPVVVIGAGPAGMAAAKAAAAVGVDVVLVDAEAKLGGQYHRQSLADATERFALPAGVEYLSESTVWAVEPIPGGHRVHIRTGPADGPGRTGRAIDTAALVLATGAHDRALPFPGWDLPGVVTAGAAQALAKSQGIAIGERVLLAGTGPFLLPVAASLVDVGARVEAVLEANTVLTGWLRPGEGSSAPSTKRGRHAAGPRAEAAATATARTYAATATRSGHGATSRPSTSQAEQPSSGAGSASGIDSAQQPSLDAAPEPGSPQAEGFGAGLATGFDQAVRPDPTTAPRPGSNPNEPSNYNAAAVDTTGPGAATPPTEPAAKRLADWSRQLSGALASPGKATELAGYLALLARHRIPYRSRHTVTAAHGDDRVEAATIARLDADWRVIPGSHRTVDVDAVCVGFGFTPQLELATALGCEVADGFVTVDIAQTTSVPGVFAAGELTGIGGAVLAEHEGTVAGTAAAIALGARASRPSKALRHIRTGRRFAAAMAAAYPIRPGWRTWLDDDTLVCRCEEVSHGQLRAAVDEHHADGVRTVKLISRAGLGRCQGRVCGRNVAELAGLPDPGAAFARRPIAVPIRLAELAGTDEAVPARLAEPPETDSREGTA